VSRLADTLHEVERIFDKLKLTRSYGGAIAYNYYGPPRLTQDLDVLVLIPDSRVPALVEELSATGWRHPCSKSASIDLRAVLAELRSSAHLAVFEWKGVRVEVFTPWHPFHHRVLERSPEEEFEDRRIRIHAAEDLIVFKKIFDRPKDLTDIKAILLSQTGKLDLDRIRNDARGLLSDESWNELDRLLVEEQGE
jgi:hypothetical protein